MLLEGDTGGIMEQCIWVIGVTLVMLLFILGFAKIMTEITIPSDKTPKDNLDNKNVDPLVNEKDKPRISPPVHSMLELMLKCPEEFVEERDPIFDRTSHTHCPSKVVFSYTECLYEGLKGFSVNNTSISAQEGEYLYQGVRFIMRTRKLKQDQVNKERRHKVDREIRKVLEEKQL